MFIATITVTDEDIYEYLGEEPPQGFVEYLKEEHRLAWALYQHVQDEIRCFYSMYVQAQGEVEHG